MAKRTWPRDSAKEGFWREVVGGHAKSGLSVKAYCGGRGVSEASFFAWRRELACRDAKSLQPAKTPEQLAPPQPRRSRRTILPAQRDVPLWSQLHVMPDKSLPRAATIEIVLPTNVRVCVYEGASRQALIDVLAVLEMAPC